PTSPHGIGTPGTTRSPAPPPPDNTPARPPEAPAAAPGLLAARREVDARDRNRPPHRASGHGPRPVPTRPRRPRPLQPSGRRLHQPRAPDRLRHPRRSRD